MYDAFWMYLIGWSSEYEILYNKYKKSRFEKINLTFIDEIIFRTKDKYSDQNFIQMKLAEIQKTLKTKEDLVNMKIDSLYVGDLIYDSYLRFYNRPTIEEINDDVLRIIEISLNIFYSFLKLIKKGKIKALINIYTCYIHHGIISRLCLEYDIDVYIIGHTNSVLIKKLEKDFPYHELNHSRFSPNRIIGEEELKLAEKTLSNRFAGIIDFATSYMRQSAFQVKETPVELKRLFSINKRNIIIYVHDFFDAPHIDRKLQFTDYYQYLKSTLENLVEVIDTTVFIKTHPNGVPGCKEITIELVQSFSLEHFVILDENVSNLNIIELRPDLICTARGTVGVEMSYFEIPTVALYDNLYCNFNFVHTCYDVETYFKICRGEIKPVIDFDKRKLFSFYYQAYLEHAVKDENDIIRQIENSLKDTYSEEYIEGLFSTNYIELRDYILDSYKIRLEKIEQEN